MLSSCLRPQPLQFHSNMLLSFCSGGGSGGAPQPEAGPPGAEAGDDDPRERAHPGRLLLAAWKPCSRRQRCTQPRCTCLWVQHCCGLSGAVWQRWVGGRQLTKA